MKFIYNIKYVLILALVFLVGCIPCDPLFIEYDEPIRVLLQNQIGDNLFKKDYNLNNLVVYENDSLAKYSIDNIDTSIVIETNKNSYDNVVFDSINTMNFYIRLDEKTMDTLVISFLPRENVGRCNVPLYEYVRWVYNSNDVGYLKNSESLTKNSIGIIKR